MIRSVLARHCRPHLRLRRRSFGRAWLCAGLLLVVAGCESSGSGDTDAASDGDDDDDATAGSGGNGCSAAPACDRGSFVGSIRVTSAAQIDEIAGYTSMTGWLEVFESDLECLEFLSCMEDVGHDVTVFGNPGLRDIDGLDNLTTIGIVGDGNLVFSENVSLTELDAINGLEVIPGSLVVNHNDSLTGVTGLNGLREVRENFTMQFNPVLSSLSGLHDLDAIDGRLVATQNPSLCVEELARVGADLVRGPDGGSTASNKPGC